MNKKRYLRWGKNTLIFILLYLAFDFEWQLGTTLAIFLFLNVVSYEVIEK